jgi:hypothetical protein
MEQFIRKQIRTTDNRQELSFSSTLSTPSGERDYLTLIESNTRLGLLIRSPSNIEPVVLKDRMALVA